jgi:hypothetical protein
LAAETVHDTPSILVSELFTRGAPRPAVAVERELPTRDGVLKVLLIPGENDVTSVVIWPPGSKYSGEPVEHRAVVEWQAWRFESRRAWVLCEWCARRCNRIFLSTTELAGSLLCRRCAGVRYRSQNYNERERLLARRDEILRQLGGRQAEGELQVHVPRRPRRMHYSRYDALVDELADVQDRLSRVVLSRVLQQELALSVEADRMTRRSSRGRSSQSRG